MTRNDLRALVALYQRLMKLYRAGDETLGWLIMNLAGTITAARLVLREPIEGEEP